MTVVANTGALYAAFEADDLHHRAVIDWLNAGNYRLLPFDA